MKKLLVLLVSFCLAGSSFAVMPTVVKVKVKKSVCHSGYKNKKTGKCIS